LPGGCPGLDLGAARADVCAALKCTSKQEPCLCDCCQPITNPHPVLTTTSSGSSDKVRSQEAHATTPSQVAGLGVSARGEWQSHAWPLWPHALPSHWRWPPRPWPLQCRVAIGSAHCSRHPARYAHARSQHSLHERKVGEASITRCLGAPAPAEC
jgi:hypothetical protein